MFKKAQGMSINMIIVAIIVLVVLVVLVMIFTGYFGGWTSNVASCQSQGGHCGGTATSKCINDAAVDSANPLPTEIASKINGKCATAGQICCPPGTTAKPE